MNASKRPPPGRALRKTLLIVGEGDAEEAFLKHLKALFVGRAGGIEVKVGNARGLETELLLLAGKPGPERTLDAKRAFHKAFNTDAHRPDLYPEVFPIPLLERHMTARPDGLVSRVIRLMTPTV